MVAWPQGIVDIETAPPIVVPYRVDLSLATWQELAQLPRVGETLAKRIVAYRDQHGPFPSIDALQEVHGIGPVMAEKMRPYLVMHTPPTREES